MSILHCIVINPTLIEVYPIIIDGVVIIIAGGVLGRVSPKRGIMEEIH